VWVVASSRVVERIVVIVQLRSVALDVNMENTFIFVRNRCKFVQRFYDVETLAVHHL
jgi:hypothetical protein